MADETYRPQRRNINPDEIEPKQAEPELQPEPKIEAHPDHPVKMNKIPPKLQAALQRQKEGGIHRPVVPKEPEMRVTGSSKLEELIKGIDAIYEEIILPSRGVFYTGEDGPTDGVLHVRSMTGEEEQILATPRFIRKGQAVNMIFNRCMQEQYNAENFLTQDRTYLLIYLRGISYSPAYDVEIKDPDSEQSFATTIDLNSLACKYCPENFSPVNLTDTLPTSGYRFRYRLARGYDDQKVQNYREQRARHLDQTNRADDTLLYRTAILVDDIEGLTDNNEIQALLKKLPINDIAYLRTLINEPPFGVDTRVVLTSPFTLQEFEVELPLEANFFFPRARRKEM